jgi:hypothetical protein
MVRSVNLYALGVNTGKMIVEVMQDGGGGTGRSGRCNGLGSCENIIYNNFISTY